MPTNHETITKPLFQQRLREFINNPSGHGLEVFSVIRNEDKTLKLKQFDAKDTLRSKLDNKLVNGYLQSNYLDEDALVLESMENVNDELASLYYLHQTEDYHPFDFLNSNVSEKFRNSDIKQLTGFAFKIRVNDRFIWAYQHVYPVSIIYPDLAIKIMSIGGNDAYDAVDSSYIVNIRDGVDVIVMDDTLYTSNIKLLESRFGFENFIRSKAEKTIDKIDSIRIVEDLSKLKEYESKQISRSKKLMNVFSSPVFEMDTDKLIEKLTTLPRYQSKVRIENGKIKLPTFKDVETFIKVLNDDFLVSELTEIEYESQNKSKLDP